MINETGKSEGREPAEAKAEEELLELGLLTLPENIKAVIDQQKTPQHPEGFEDIIDEKDSLEKIGKAMKEKNIRQVIHAEGPNVWDHAKSAIKLVAFLDVSDEKKADLKLIMLYHDLGKTTPGMRERQQNKEILAKELKRGKLYQPVKGHANERIKDVENGFMANGISGHKLDVFMTVVKNHMESSLSEMIGKKLVELFDGFGKTDDERKEAAELLALAVQVDGNAGPRIDLDERGEAGVFLKDNKTGLEFENIWKRYLDARK